MNAASTISPFAPFLTKETTLFSQSEKITIQSHPVKNHVRGERRLSLCLFRTATQSEIPVFRVLSAGPAGGCRRGSIPFPVELAPHEEQFLSGECRDSRKKPEAGKLLPCIPGHFPEHGPLAVDHLVVGEGKFSVKAYIILNVILSCSYFGRWDPWR